MRWATIVVAGGSGSRVGAEKNKILLNIEGEPIFLKSLKAFSAMDSIVLVHRPEDLEEIQRVLERSSFPKEKLIFVQGGLNRGDSVQNGLKMVVDCDFVLVHDAARPFVKLEEIEKLKVAVQETGAAILASPVHDTLKKVDAEGNICTTVDREALYHAQTPQGFRMDLLKEAYRFAKNSGLNATDDAGLVEAMGKKVRIVEASSSNKKITRSEDLLMDSFRIGHGFDVHKLVEGRKLILCGVEIPYEKGLLGHSDADVATHTLMDAMLGAMALGDIGRHFPDTDTQYKGADSIDLLRRVDALVREKGYRLYQADITIIAQAPKMAPHVQAMRERLAEVLGIAIDYINVKASTTEKLGFTGRGEGIACEAVCMLKSLEA